MAINRRNINPIGFVTDERQLSFNRTAAYGSRHPHPVPLGFISPFQIVRTSDESNVAVIKLHKRSDGTVIDITADMFSTGLEIKDFATYKLWTYPGTIAISTAGIEEGVWFMTLEDGSGNTLFREDWGWRNIAELEGMVKVEWFHQRDFKLPFGHIDFVAPFKYWHYFDTELGKPDYPVERDVEERLGFEYLNYIVSWIEQRFVTAGDKNFMDAMSFVQQMDCVNVYFLGDKINAFRVIVTPEWEERGDLAAIEFEIRSDQVTTVFGDALGEKEYTVQCVDVAFSAKAQIDLASAEWVNGYYINQAGEQVNFSIGNRVLVRDLGDFFYRLFTYIGPANYQQITFADEAIVFNENSGEYLINTSAYQVTKPRITNIQTSILDPDKLNIQAFGFPNTILEVWGENGGIEELLESVTLAANKQISKDFDPKLNTRFQVRVHSWKCPQSFAFSDWYALDSNGNQTGIGIMVVENSFTIT